MTVVEEYIATLSGANKRTVEHMYAVVRKLVPDATEELCYAMPALKYRGKGLFSVMQTKQFLSLYPFSGKVVSKLAAELKDYECTTGSIHFSTEHPISDDLLQIIIETRLQEITS